MRYRRKAEAVAQEIIEAFREGRVPAALADVFLRRGERPAARWSWSNQMIAVLHGHPDARGFRQWQKVGRQVSKGERAFHILGPCTRRATEADVDLERAVEAGDPILFGFTSIPVFGYVQTEGEPLPGAEEDRVLLDRLPFVEVARAWNIELVTYSGAGAPARGLYSSSGRISLGVANFSTWAHELVHAADQRLGSRNAADPGDKPLAEAVAELGSAVLLECVGETVASDRGGALRYIEAYALSSRQTVVSLCTAVLDRTCNCVASILATRDEIVAATLPEDSEASLEEPVPEREAAA